MNVLQASRLTARSMQLASVLACSVALLGFQFAERGVSIFTKNEVVAGYALTFVRCRLLALPALLSINAMSGCFRGHQDTRCGLAIKHLLCCMEMRNSWLSSFCLVCYKHLDCSSHALSFSTSNAASKSRHKLGCRALPIAMLRSLPHSEASVAGRHSSRQSSPTSAISAW